MLPFSLSLELVSFEWLLLWHHWLDYPTPYGMTKETKFFETKLTFRRSSCYVCFSPGYKHCSQMLKRCCWLLSMKAFVKSSSSVRTLLTNLIKVASAFTFPNGMTVKLKYPKIVTNAPLRFASSSNGTCQYPFVKSYLLMNLAMLILFKIASILDIGLG